MAKFYHWSPKEAWGLRWSELRWWADQADQMMKGK
jgi:hypothetical protein